MQLGISTYTYGWAVGVPGSMPEKPMTEIDLLTKAQDFGVKLVQLGDNLPLHTLPQKRIENLNYLAKQWGISLEIGARKLTPDHLSNYIELAKKLNAKLLRFVIDTPDYEPKLDEIIEIIKGSLSHLQEVGVTLGLENHDRIKAKEFAYIIEKVGSKRVGICLDSVNSIGAGEGLEQIVDTLAPYTVNLHIKDFGIKRLPHLMGFQIDGRPAGKGMLTAPWLLEKIRPFNRCHTAVLEQWVVPENDIRATVAKEERWAVESMTYLKSFFEL